MPKGDALMVGPYVLLDPTNEVRVGESWDGEKSLAMDDSPWFTHKNEEGFRLNYGAC